MSSGIYIRDVLEPTELRKIRIVQEKIHRGLTATNPFLIISAISRFGKTTLATTYPEIFKDADAAGDAVAIFAARDRIQEPGGVLTHGQFNCLLAGNFVTDLANLQAQGYMVFMTPCPEYANLGLISSQEGTIFLINPKVEYRMHLEGRPEPLALGWWNDWSKRGATTLATDELLQLVKRSLSDRKGCRLMSPVVAIRDGKVVFADSSASPSRLKELEGSVPIPQKTGVNGQTLASFPRLRSGTPLGLMKILAQTSLELGRIGGCDEAADGLWTIITFLRKPEGFELNAKAIAQSEERLLEWFQAVTPPGTPLFAEGIRRFSSLRAIRTGSPGGGRSQRYSDTLRILTAGFGPRVDAKCTHIQRGKCEFGPLCRFSHEV